MRKTFNILLRRVALIMALVVVASIMPGSLSAQISQEALRAHWILTLSEYVEWPGNEYTEEYSIGVFGTTAPEYNELVKMRDSNSKIKGKPFSVHQFKKVKDLTPTHILYVNSAYNSDLQAISNRLKTDSTLIIVSDTASDKNLQPFFMINLLLKGRANQFQVNSGKASSVGIDISDKVLAQGGTKIDLLTLVETKNKELQERENMLMLQERNLQAQANDLYTQKLQNDIEEQSIRIAKVNLENQEHEIERQREIADSLVKHAENLKGLLARNDVRLKDLAVQIQDKQEELDKSTADLAEQQKKPRRSTEADRRAREKTQRKFR